MQPVLPISLLVGLLTAGAVIALWAGLTGTDTPTTPRPPFRTSELRRRAGTVTLVAAAAAAAWGVTGWPVAAMLTVAAVWLVPQSIRQAARNRHDRQMLDATRMWLLQLRTTLRAGVGLESALRDTARLVRPDSPLAGPLARLVERLGWMPPATALERFAHEVDNHVADAATTVLRSSLEHSNQGIAATLQALGAWADEDLRHLRQVEAEARGLRLAKRVVLGIWAGMAGYLAVTSPELMAPYASLEGQLVLLGLLAVAGAAVWLLGRWTVVHRPERFFRHHPEVTP